MTTTTTRTNDPHPAAPATSLVMPMTSSKSLPTALASLAALGCLLLAADRADAKPLYITVNRTFASSEAPMVDVSFESKGPVELRVLKPSDKQGGVEAYLDREANLRRTWQEPPTSSNPGRALSRGLNELRGPGTWLLLALSPEMRTELAPALGERMEKATTTGARLAEGNKKLVGVPDGMELVRSQWLNLDLGGDQREFDVPGFEAWGGSSQFEDRRVALKPLPAGLYVLQLVQGTIEAQVVLVVTDLTVQVKQTDGKLLARVAGRDQRPVAGADVAVRVPGNKEKNAAQKVSGTTDASGEVMLDVAEPRVLVSVKKAGGGATDLAIVDTDFYSTLATTPDVFLYTDRPIYHPGDEVRFRGVVRKPDSFLARLFLPEKRAVSVELFTAEGTASKTSVNVDDFGSFFGTLKAPAEAATGVMRVTASIDGRGYQGETRVQDYVKPTFFVETTPASETIVPGSTLTAKIHAERYAGGPPKARYEVTLTRSTLDAPAWVDDAGMGSKGSAVTYGSASTTEGKLSVPDRVYSSLADRLDNGTAEASDTWASAPEFDEKGDATISVMVPALKPGEERTPYKYTLSVRARDDQGTFAGSSTPLFLSPYEAMGSLRLSSKLVKVGATATLAVRSTTLSGKPYPKAEVEVAIAYRNKNGDERAVDKKALTTDDEGKGNIEVKGTDAGSLVLRVSVKDKKGAAWTGEERLLVVGNGGEAVEWVPEMTLLSTTTTLSSGDTVDLIAMLPDEWGPGGKNEGPLWLTLGGTTLFQTRLLQAKGNTVVVPIAVEKRYGSGVYASLAYPTRSGRWEERTVPFRIVPKERVLGVRVEPERKEAAPSGEQTLRLQVDDHRGRGVRAEVSISVVDKAVYAVQPEFRPSILDFFYPLARHNVSTFHSLEFQGYGYGHVLAQRLARMSGTAFAAVKPPKKKDDDKDTAYWNGSVVTNDDGSATVTFKLPANQTLWTVTAVVADTSGRVGEGTAQFATRGKLNVVTALPKFLRVGDDASGVLRVSRPPKSDFKGALDASVTADGPITAQLPAAGKLDLTTAKDLLLPISLQGKQPGTASIALALRGGPTPLFDTRSVPVIDNVVVDPIQVSRLGGGALSLAVPAGAKLAHVELVLEPTLVDAALADLRELLIYPHGCLEQLVSTTTPVLALSRTLDTAKVTALVDADTQSLLAEARSRAAYGVARILDHAQKGGGFTWFVGDNNAEPSLEMTLVALEGLLPAVDAGLVSARDPRIQASLRWLEQRGELPPLFDSARALALAGYEGDKHAARARALVEGLGANSGRVAVAKAALAASYAHVLDEDAVKAKLTPLLADVHKAFVGADASGMWGASGDELRWSYPIHDVGAAAVLGRAATLVADDASLAALDKRFRTLFVTDYLSTFDRGALLLAALPLVEKRAAQHKAMALPTVAGATFVPRGLGFAAALPDGTSSITAPAFDGIATLRADALIPAQSAPAMASGYVLERKLYALNGGSKREIPTGGAVAHGEVVYVELTVRLAGERGWRSAYTVVEAPIPAGFVALQEDKEYRGAPLELVMTHDAVKRRAFSNDKVSFYVDEPAWWMDQVRTLGFVMRADFAGRFQLPGATAEDMYASSARARTTSSTIVVNPPETSK